MTDLSLMLNPADWPDEVLPLKRVKSGIEVGLLFTLPPKGLVFWEGMTRCGLGGICTCLLP